MKTKLLTGLLSAWRRSINGVVTGQAETKVIKTEAGTLELVPATVDQLRGIAQY